MVLQLPVGQFALQDGRQVAKDVGVQRGRPAETGQCRAFTESESGNAFSDGLNGLIFSF